MARPAKQSPITCENFVWHLRQRDGVYYADGRFNETDLGKHSLGTRDRREALDNLRKLDRVKAVQLEKVTEDKPTSTSTISIEQGWTVYLDDRKKPQLFGGVSGDSWKRYKAVRDKHVKYCRKQGVGTWNEINETTAEAYGLWLHGRKYAERTVHFEVTQIKTVVIWLIENKLLPAECRINLPLVKPDGCDAYCYTVEQVSAMVRLCRSQPELTWMEVLIIGLACTGLRIDELANLRWTDVDLNAGVIRLTDERWSHRRRQIGKVRRTKGKRSRSLPIHPDLLALLKSLSRTPDGLVFHGPTGEKLCDSTARVHLVDDVISPLASKFPTPPDELGFEHGRLHSFRHYFCSESFRHGATEAELLEWLGHRESKMVAHYRHLRPDDAKRKMQQIKFFDLGGDETPS